MPTSALLEAHCFHSAVMKNKASGYIYLSTLFKKVWKCKL
jgi:hypothetical protein